MQIFFCESRHLFPQFPFLTANFQQIKIWILVEQIIGKSHNRIGQKGVRSECYFAVRRTFFKGKTPFEIFGRGIYKDDSIRL